MTRLMHTRRSRVILFVHNFPAKIAINIKIFKNVFDIYLIFYFFLHSQPTKLHGFIFRDTNDFAKTINVTALFAVTII